MSFSSTGLRVRLLTIDGWNDTIPPAWYGRLHAAGYPSLTCVSDATRPHRLAAQDGALSRLKQGFESPWGHLSIGKHTPTVLYCLARNEKNMTNESPTLPSNQESKPGTVYVIECFVCKYTVERPTLDIDLGEHRDPTTGYFCYGMGVFKELKLVP